MYLRALILRYYVAIVVAILIVLPVVVKAPLLTGLLVSDPVSLYAGLDTERGRGLTAGGPTIDPNIGYVSHAVGTYAARELVAGRIAWWNPYEGVGAPLAAGMQAAALFPLSPILLLPHGQVLLHLLLQIIGGLAAFGLLRSLRLGRVAAAAGAVVFEFNGVFAWMANAVVNPVAFLPLMLWGVEWQRHRDRRRPLGIVMIALGIAMSLYAGFPETAYLNGLFVAVWAALRIVEARGVRKDAAAAALRIGGAGLAGLLLSAPIVVPFLSYLPHAELGMHGAGGETFHHLDGGYGLLLMLPYFLGGIFQQPIEEPFWGNVGGYCGLMLIALAIGGLLGRRERRLRWLMAGWIVVSLALTYGASWLFTAISWVPGIGQAALYRYLPSSWLMAMIVLAGFALDDLRRGGGTRRVAGAAAATGALAVVLLVLGHAITGWAPRGAYAVAATAPQLLLFAAFFAFVVSRPLSRHAGAALGAIVALEALWLFLLPVLAHPRQVRTEVGGVQFLQRNLGLERFVTLGPVSPNYGTYFGIGQANHNDLPTPKLWTDYARRRLDPGAHPILFTRISSPQVIGERLPAYSEAGIGYVVAPSGTSLPGITKVYSDAKMTIHRLPRPAAYMDAPGCAVSIASREQAVVECSRPARLIRRELAMPGWRAAVSGKDAPIFPAHVIFQAVDIPAGRHAVAFHYRPPHAIAAFALALVGGLLLMLLVGLSIAAMRARVGRNTVVS